MSSVLDELREVGFSPGAAEDPAALQLECARLARLVRASNARTLGLAPAGEDAAVPGVALKLAQYLASSSHQPVGVVDALGRWGPGTAEEGSPSTTWLLDGLALLSVHASHPSLALEQLRGCLAAEATHFRSVIVDLTGFAQRGELRAALELLDAAAVVARCGRTTVRQVRAALDDVPEGRGLGVLLTGA
jgi:hypothetical protein